MDIIDIIFLTASVSIMAAVVYLIVKLENKDEQINTLAEQLKQVEASRDKYKIWFNTEYEAHNKERAKRKAAESRYNRKCKAAREADALTQEIIDNQESEIARLEGHIARYL